MLQKNVHKIPLYLTALTFNGSVDFVQEKIKHMGFYARKLTHGGFM